MTSCAILRLCLAKADTGNSGKSLTVWPWHKFARPKRPRNNNFQSILSSIVQSNAEKLTESCNICIRKINNWDKRNECAVFPINNDFNFVIWYTLNDYACIKTIVKTGVWMYPCVHRKISTSVDPKSLLYWRRYVT